MVPTSGAGRSRRLPRAALGCALGLVGVAVVIVVTRYGELSGEALVAVGAVGAVLAVVGLARRSGEAAPPVGRRGAGWLVWLTALGAWELLTLSHDSLWTVSDLLDPVLAHPLPRAVATVGWFLGGLWLVDRPGRRRGTARASS